MAGSAWQARVPAAVMASVFRCLGTPARYEVERACRAWRDASRSTSAPGLDIVNLTTMPHWRLMYRQPI
jgi:hypothetical protein